MTDEFLLSLSNIIFLSAFLTTSDNSMVIRLGFSTFFLLHLCISGEEEKKCSKVDEHLITIPKHIVYFLKMFC